MDEDLPASSDGTAESTNGSTAKPEADADGSDGAAPMEPAALEQWKRWTFDQIDNGRTEEDVIAELVASGFAPEEAAGLVDEMSRRAEALWTRSSLAQTPSALFASRSQIPASAGKFSLVGSVANVFIALYRLIFSDADDELLPRKKPENSEEKSNEA